MMIIIMMFIFFTMSRSRPQGGSRQIETYSHPWYRAQQSGSWELEAPRQPQQLDAPMTPESRKALDADITSFGDELRDLDLDVVGRELSPEAQEDYTTALDNYENAKQALAQARMESDVPAITHILEEGRYAVECVKARAEGRKVPERRPPCFFDPSHGPSVANIEWAPDGGVAREVPACALDVARVRSGANPHIRMVDNRRGQVVPYWDDPRQVNWVRGYYGGYEMDPVIRGLTQGAVMMSVFGLLGAMFRD